MLFKSKPYYAAMFYLVSLALTGLLGSCQKPATTSTSLPVYIEDPKLFYALAIYQREQDSAPISIHLQPGLEMFFQLSGGERPIKTTESLLAAQQGQRAQATLQNKGKGLDNSVARLELGGGLFLSSGLQQMSQPELYLEELPEELHYEKLRRQSRAQAQTYELNFPESDPVGPYLTPVLLYPALFEFVPGELPAELDVFSDPLLRNLEQSQLPRLLSSTWLAEQLLEAPRSNYRQEVQEQGGSSYIRLQAARRILLEYLKTLPLRLNFRPAAIEDGSKAADASSPGLLELRLFIRSYRELLRQQQTVQAAPPQAATDAQSYPTNNSGNPDLSSQRTLRQLGDEFARQQQGLYGSILPGYLSGASLGYRDTLIEPHSYPYLYFLTPSLRSNGEPGIGSTGSKAVLQLQLEKVLWAGLSKDLGEVREQQALKLLRWLQSREGQLALQQKLPRLDKEHSLGIYRGLSIYPEVNVAFWRDLQLDWPARFAIHWQLPHQLVQWQPELFQGLSLAQELLLRRQSAKSIIHSFLLPYLFLAEDQKGMGGTGMPSQALDWSLWLPL